MSTPTTIRVWESEFAVYRKVWQSHLLLAFVQPLLYLLGIGLGVGALVDANTDSTTSLGDVSYFEFLGPALLATTAMMSAGQASLWQVLDGFFWGNRYRAMAATPLSSDDIASGLSLWHATRTTIGVAGVAVVLACFDDTRSWGLLAAVPVAVLTGLAFALPITAWSSTRYGDGSFPTIIRFGLLPMFLFGGAFFPVDQLPGWLQPVAYVTPLWHGVELCRGVVIDSISTGNALVHLTVIGGYVVAGWVACRIAFARRLAP
jgi:lipooligosaccharide transport system permease protein